MEKWIMAVFLSVGVTPMDDALRVRVSPGVAMSPAAIRVTAIVQPHEANRALTVVVESNVYRQSQRISIEGAEPRRTFVVRFNEIPEGEYVIKATLKRNDGSATSAVTSLKVLAEDRAWRVALPVARGGAS